MSVDADGLPDLPVMRVPITIYAPRSTGCCLAAGSRSRSRSSRANLKTARSRRASMSWDVMGWFIEQITPLYGKAAVQRAQYFQGAGRPSCRTANSSSARASSWAGSSWPAAAMPASTARPALVGTWLSRCSSRSLPTTSAALARIDSSTWSGTSAPPKPQPNAFTKKPTGL